MSDLLSRLPGVSVCSWDLNLRNSNLALLVGKEGEPNSWATLADALTTGKLGPRTAHEAAVQIKHNWHLITGPAHHNDWVNLCDPAQTARLAELIRPGYDFVLMDLAAGMNPLNTWALSTAQTVLITVSAHFPDVIDTAKAYERLVAEGILVPDRCCLVLSPWIDSPELPPDDVSDCFGLPIAARVPLAPQPAMAAARNGRPITQLGTADARPLAEAYARVCALVAAPTGGSQTHGIPPNLPAWLKR